MLRAAGDAPGGDADVEPVAAGRRAIADLRRARRARRTANFDIAEAIYRAYITGIVAAVAVWLGSGLVGDTRAGAATVNRVSAHGAAAIGLGVALALAVGLRSGGRGGPLVVEAADVRHVLLAPVDRATALRGPALRQVRFGVAAGAGVGACGGLLAFRRLPGPAAGWVASGALVGATTVAAGLGLAMVVSGRRLGPRWANVAALAVVAWAVADLVGGTLTSPAGAIASVAIWPLRFGAAGPIGVALALVAVAAGRAVVGGTSIEGAERRASLVGQIRFAATTRDLRTVVILRRQLAQEAARSRPWIHLAAPVTAMGGAARITAARRTGPVGRAGRVRGGARLGAWRRSWQSILRFPGARLVRMVVAGAGAGAALVGAWRGTTPLLLVAAGALYVAALDAVEPLAQELDHPDRCEAYGVEDGLLLLRLAAPPVLVMVGVAVVGAITAAIIERSITAVEIGAVLSIPAAAAATAGATLSVVAGAAPSYSSSDAVLPPEMAGARALIRTGLPPLVVLAGVLPVLAGRHPAAGSSGLTGVAGVEAPVLLAVVLAAMWIRYRTRLAAAWRGLMDEASASRRPGPRPAAGE